RPTSSPPLAASENFRNSRRSRKGALIWHRLSPSWTQLGGWLCECEDKYRSGRYSQSLPRRCPGPLAAAFLAAAPLRSSVVLTDNIRTAEHLRRSRLAVMDDSGPETNLR